MIAPEDCLLCTPVPKIMLTENNVFSENFSPLVKKTCERLEQPEFMYTESAYMLWREGKGKEESIFESPVWRAE